MLALLLAASSPPALAQLEEIKTVRSELTRLQDQSRWLEAMPVAEELVRLTVKQYGEQNTNTADALHLWAWLVQQNGDYGKAEELWLRALAIDQALFGTNTLETTRRLHLLATVYLDQRDFQRAMPLLEKALQIREKHLGPDHVETAQVVRSIGRLHVLGGDLAAAEAAFLRAGAAYERAEATSRPALAATYSSLGWVYLAFGDYDKAMTMVKRSLDLRKALYGLEHVTTASNIRELGLIQRLRGQLDEAESLLLQSVEIMERLLGDEHVFLADTLDELGVVYRAKGELDRAEALLQRVQRILENGQGKQSQRTASVLEALSELEESRGNYEQAKTLVAQACKLRELLVGLDHSATLKSLRRLAVLEIALGRHTDAFAAAERLQAGQEKVLANVLSFTSERQRLANQRQSPVFKHRFDVWAMLGATEQLARSVVRTKGIVLDSLIEDRLLASASEDDSGRDLVRQITEARRQLSQRVAEVTQKKSGAGLSALAERIESLETALARRVTGLGQARRALGVEVQDIQAILPEGTALMEIIRYSEYAGRGQHREHYGALILSRAAAVSWVGLGEAAILEKAVRLYQHALRSSHPPKDLANVLQELSALLWRPLAAKLPDGTRRLIVSPDGELNFVSFATLLTAAGRFVGEEYLFSYVSCARDLLAEARNESVSRQLIIYANPDFGVPSMSQARKGRHLRDFTFLPLPGAEQEGRLLYKRAQELGFREARLHIGPNATETRLYGLSAPEVLHLATHGFNLPKVEPPQISEGHSLLAKEWIPGLNPMLRCGLVLAGAGRTLKAWREGRPVPADNDGIVTADEIGQLNLRGTRLVVLSACDTGGGETQAGEGVLGLRRAFVQAGAQNLVLTLWPIDDDKTAELMCAFYSEARRERPLAFALAKVQQSWLKELRRGKGVPEACRTAGPFILSFQGNPGYAESFSAANGHQ